MLLLHHFSFFAPLSLYPSTPLPLCSFFWAGECKKAEIKSRRPKLRVGREDEKAGDRISAEKSGAAVVGPEQGGRGESTVAFERTGFLGVFEASMVGARWKDLLPIPGAGERAEPLSFVHKNKAMGIAHFSGQFKSSHPGGL
jgi:hypothetical protein